jgi:uncharacterized protein YecT (DUF1311 family)
MKIKKINIIILIASIIIPISSQAETKYDTAYSKCIDEAGTMNNGVMASCSESVSILAKKDITTLYKEIEGKIKIYDDSSEIIKTFESSQKAWIEYRNNNCILSERIAAHEPYCLMLINSQRAEELKVLAE